MVRLGAIHSCYILHGDKHPRNILLSKFKGPVWVSAVESGLPVQAHVFPLRLILTLWTQLRVSEFS